MKTNSKKMFKKLLSVAMSLAMALVLVVGFTFSPAASVSAAVNEVETLSAGQTKTFVFSEEQYAIIDVAESGLYQLEITDNYAGANFTIVTINDYSNELNTFMLVDQLDEKYTSNLLLLFENNDYELALGSFRLDDNQLPYLTSGNLTITLKKVDVQPTTIGSTSVVENVTAEADTYLEYTTSNAGDYTLSFDPLSAYITVYNADTGVALTKRDTEYYHNYYGWTPGTKLVFRLSGNTKYYFCVYNYDVDAEITFSISKNSKTVSDIVPSRLAVALDSYSDIGPEIFDYKVSYSNNTTSTLSYLQLAQAGIEAPEVYEYEDYIYANTWLLEGGKTPIISVYNDYPTLVYVDVESITDWLIDENIRATGAGATCLIEYESDDEYMYWWRIKVNETGVYGIWRYNDDDFRTNFEYYNIEIIDEYNHIVEFNDNMSGWPLVKGREYALSFAYQYDYAHTYNDIEFWLQKSSQKLYSDVSSGNWFNDSVTYAAGRGIMSGYGGTTKFGAADGIQRQDFMVMLARLEGVYLEDYEYDSPFPDVASGSYYEAAINWGYENGIVAGYQNGEFGVGDKITREQIVTFLYRYANYSLADTEYSMTESALKRKFSDYAYINDYAIEPMLWAVENGVISGKTSNTVVPYGNALRCEVAQIMYNIHINDVI